MAEEWDKLRSMRRQYSPNRRDVDKLGLAVAEGRNLVIIWEQRGCPYCREMHRVNLRIPEIVDYIKANFDVIQLNLWGDLDVVDTGGEVLTEKQLDRRFGRYDYARDQGRGPGGALSD